MEAVKLTALELVFVTVTGGSTTGALDVSGEVAETVAVTSNDGSVE